MVGVSSSPPPSSWSWSRSSSSKRSFVLRQHEGWKTIVALLYVVAGQAIALWWMLVLSGYRRSNNIDDGSNKNNNVDGHDNDDGTKLGWLSSLLALGCFVGMSIPPIILSAHCKLIAAYLVHEACHDSIFVRKEGNRRFGVMCLWVCCCPYVNYSHVKRMHVAHHVDRTDLVEFDYRTFVSSNVVLKSTVMASEFVGIPAVETIMHLRQAFIVIIDWNVLQRDEIDGFNRIKSCMIGTPSLLVWYFWLWRNQILVPQIVSGMLLLQTLALNDSFQHTYEAVFPEDYTPGPGMRTAQYEEDNTYSNVWSTSYPILNLFMLNFGYHNAHHKRPMVPWYQLPVYHDELYSRPRDGSRSDVVGNNKVSTPPNDGDKKTERPERSKSELSSSFLPLAKSSPQVLPLCDLVSSWYKHRLRRVVEDDYGVVYPAGTPNRATDFVGALGVSFLTV
mmetsp:Transcript_4162/g.10288  ORF Transcript_4162/g.10288 Transcript_4162/m.10288 type:complete len:447 (-) Transcript_4162:134-1474(-)|eukprot:CAMPEP_0113466624 /NCGR_PEP_ID=MMETSP0014_2-20120614/14373_1 /TAXON_ID=2857 /ORGANISM="Nitzschia sp." /LENGTH=446 /DNA_ID=CAMNT_0000358863 /DNA_START=195 /DNA_END=1535 /DNA_ORIENTATION=- /assembly_acc=CAM_ASM_000159